MYAAYFGLKQEPFSIAPDPRLLFMSERHREALAHLLYGLGGGGGFVLLTGEIGTGKTTVCRAFIEQVPPHCNLAYIFNPKLTVAELLQTVCHEFGIAVPQAPGIAPTVKDHLDPLNGFLLAQHAAGRNNVLVIDEAQNLSADVLEQLRLLTNLETTERKLLQIILVGQPELRTMLARPELEQLAQRVIARYHLQALTEAETAQYIRHRLDASGLERPMPFDRRAMRRIHQRTGGVPRRINLLCDRALLGAFATGQAMVTPAIVDKAAAEVFEPMAAPPGNVAWRPALALAAGVVIGVGALAAWRHLATPEKVATAGAMRPAATAAAARVGMPGVTAAPPAPVPGTVAAAAAVPAASEPAVPVAPAASASPVALAPVAAASVPASAPVSAPLADGQGGPSPSPAPTLLRDLDTAWRELAQAWGAQPAAGEPCDQLARQQLQCFSRPMSLALIRQLGRPGIVTLDAASGRPSYALLTGLTDATATLRAGGTEQTVTLAALADRWNGDFRTLWRTPPGWQPNVPDGGRGPLVDWVAASLATARGARASATPAVLNPQLAAGVRAFQLAQGLPADGRLGALTYMQLNRAAAVDEPRLRNAS